MGKSMGDKGFQGFHPRAIQFLDELAAHNNRDWFSKHKSRYESDVLAPALEFIGAMQGPLSKISPHFRAVPKRTGGSLMRIYRDTRFSRDKTPYKTNVGIQFRHEKGKDVHAPGFYIHISPEECFIGCGIWHPDTTTLGKIRKTINKDQAGWKRLSRSKSFLAKYRLAGDSLKRPPKGFDADHPLIDDLKRKDFIAICDLDYDDLFDASIVRHVTSRFRTGKGLMKFLCEAIGLSY